METSDETISKTLFEFREEMGGIFHGFTLDKLAMKMLIVKFWEKDNDWIEIYVKTFRNEKNVDEQVQLLQSERVQRLLSAMTKNWPPDAWFRLIAMFKPIFVFSAPGVTQYSNLKPGPKLPQLFSFSEQMKSLQTSVSSDISPTMFLLANSQCDLQHMLFNSDVQSSMGIDDYQEVQRTLLPFLKAHRSSIEKNIATEEIANIFSAMDARDNKIIKITQRKLDETKASISRPELEQKIISLAKEQDLLIRTAKSEIKEQLSNVNVDLNFKNKHIDALLKIRSTLNANIEILKRNQLTQTDQKSKILSELTQLKTEHTRIVKNGVKMQKIYTDGKDDLIKFTPFSDTQSLDELIQIKDSMVQRLEKLKPYIVMKS